MQMRIVIVGAGDTGMALAKRLSKRHPVLLLDREPEHLEDTEDAEEVHAPESGAAQTQAGSGLLFFKGDGCSRLVLQHLYEEIVNCALVAVTGDDETNLEVGRIGRELGYEPVAALQHSALFGERYSAEHIITLDRTQLVVDEIERSLRHRGAVVARGVGLGRGELVQIRLVRTSPLIGRPLQDLRPHRWRVAAIFRGDDVIVPVGDTTMEADDRVLLVGDPHILATVSEYLRLGKPQFPQPYGPHVITLEYSASDASLLQEAEVFIQKTEAMQIVRGIPDAENVWPRAESDLENEPDADAEADRTTFSLRPPDHDDFGADVVRNLPGLVVTRSEPRPWLARAIGHHGHDAQICDGVNRPVLFARGSAPYKRILLPVSYSELNIPAAEVALDLTRQMEASLTAMNVDHPKFISGLEDEDVHEEVVPIRRLCELYEVELEYRHAWGNPVRHLVRQAAQHDLVVVARWQRRADSYFNPDVALRVAALAPCSVLVLTRARTR
jgi:trk/ktr system potassium uptake protein